MFPKLINAAQSAMQRAATIAPSTAAGSGEDAPLLPPTLRPGPLGDLPGWGARLRSHFTPTAVPTHRQRHIDGVARLFRKLGDCHQPDAIAVPLASLYHQMAHGAGMTDAECIRFMPELIEKMLAAGQIAPDHAELAMAAAERVSRYAALLVLPRDDVCSLAAGSHSRPRSFTAALLFAAIDPGWLERRLNDSAQHARLVGSPRMTARFPVTGYPYMQANLEKAAADMESQAFLSAGLSGLLRDRIPELLDACRTQERPGYR